MKKKEALAHWKKLKANQPILDKMTAIPYKASGSTFGACGIRIDGSPEFIDAVLSHLKELIKGEGIETRLGLSRNKVKSDGIHHKFNNSDVGNECCYIRLHERGREGMMLQAIIADRAGEEE